MIYDLYMIYGVGAQKYVPFEITSRISKIPTNAAGRRQFLDHDVHIPVGFRTYFSVRAVSFREGIVVWFLSSQTLGQ